MCGVADYFSGTSGLFLLKIPTLQLDLQISVGWVGLKEYLGVCLFMLCLSPLQPGSLCQVLLGCVCAHIEH